MNQYVSFYSRLKSSAETNFPSVKEIDAISWDHLVSPHVLKLPQAIYTKANRAIRALYGLSRRASYQQALSANQKFPFAIDNDSVLMAYDFHTNSKGEAKLVEINTNASGYIFSALMNCAHESVDLKTSPYVSELKRSFDDEGAKPQSKITIVDDNLPEQKMYSEFLMYRDLFHSWGLKSDIREASDSQLDKVDFVYNRSTDFYLDQPNHQKLHEVWSTQKTIVSPQPREYFLLADKERLVDFTKPNWLKESGASEEELNAINDILIPSYEKKDFASVDELWSRRRTLFFKPKHAYGGKSVYRGESVSRKVFDRLMGEDILIQNFVPASPIPNIAAGDPLQNWKFDVRFYVYRDRIQQVAARLYQGQVTNFSTPFGGFTRIEFV